MKYRCFNPNYHAYHRYGGRGITVYEPWIKDSRAFINWVRTNLGDRPPGCSLDRIDNDGNYEPGNLEWSSQSDQTANQWHSWKPTVRRGVTQDSDGRWRAVLTVIINLGDYDTVEAATAAYEKAEQELELPKP